MSLINTTYFVGDILIPQTESSQLQEVINRIEKQILIDALGYDLYKQFIAALLGSPAQKWLDLRDGKDYTVEDINGDTVAVRWNGFINDEKTSLIAYFVYEHFMKHYNVQASGVGEVMQMGENSNRAPQRAINQKIVDAQNNGIELYGKRIDFAGSDAILRGKRFNLTRTDYYEEVLKGTLYNFIYFTNLETPDTYTPFNFTPKEKINILGI